MEKDQKDMISEIIEAFEKYAGHQAFVINNITYTYRQLSETVYKISTTRFTRLNASAITRTPPITTG